MATILLVHLALLVFLIPKDSVAAGGGGVCCGETDSSCDTCEGPQCGRCNSAGTCNARCCRCKAECYPGTLVAPWQPDLKTTAVPSSEAIRAAAGDRSAQQQQQQEAPPACVCEHANTCTCERLLNGINYHVKLTREKAEYIELFRLPMYADGELLLPTTDQHDFYFYQLRDRVQGCEEIPPPPPSSATSNDKEVVASLVFRCFSFAINQTHCERNAQTPKSEFRGEIRMDTYRVKDHSLVASTVLFTFRMALINQKTTTTN